MTWNDGSGASSSDGGTVSRRFGVNEQHWQPRLTYTLLGVIAGVFVLQLMVLGDRSGPRVADIIWHGIPHIWYSFLFVIDTDWMWRPWSLVTSTLSHGSVQHILFNGMSLFFFGPSVERLLGWKRTLALFFVGGALSGVCQVHLMAWQETGNPLAIGAGALGASGALMAFLGTLMILTPRTKMFMMMIPIPVPLWVAGIGYAAMDILGVFNPASGIGHVAHLSGLALGLICGIVVLQRWRQQGIRIVYNS